MLPCTGEMVGGPTRTKRRSIFTFTANLAGDIQDNLRKICTVEELRRIEVIHLDLWVARFLQELDYNYRIIYGDELSRLWSDAIALTGESLDFPEEFYQDEWSKVIQAKEAFTLEDYVRVSRRGCGVGLDVGSDGSMAGL